MGKRVITMGNRLPVFLFPVAAETNGHRLDGLKQQKFVLRQFWGQKSQVNHFRAPWGGALPCLLQLRGFGNLWLASRGWNYFTVYLHLNILFLLSLPPCVCVCLSNAPLLPLLQEYLPAFRAHQEKFKTTSSQDP